MNARHADRLWMIGGLAVIVVLALASWLLLIGPKFADTSDVETQAADTQTQLTTLRKRINELKQQQANLKPLQAALDKKQKALPADTGLPAFLRQLQAAGEALDVDVTDIAVSSPTMLSNLPTVWSLPITLNAQGAPAKLDAFLRGLQGSSQSRAVLVQTVSLSSTATNNGNGGATAKARDLSLSLSLNAFVAPSAGSGTPTVTTN